MSEDNKDEVEVKIGRNVKSVTINFKPSKPKNNTADYVITLIVLLILAGLYMGYVVFPW